MASSLLLFAIPLRAVPYALVAHNPDRLFSIMPREEATGTPLQIPTSTKRHWCEVYDCHFAEEDLSPRARRRTIAGFKAEYGRDTPHLITGIKVRELLLQIDDLIDNARLKPQTAVFHCHGGVSRSQAAAFIALCMILGPGRERDAMANLLKANRYALPNPMLVWQADRLLKRNGAMIAALSMEPSMHEASSAQGLKIDLNSELTSLIDFYS